MRRETGRVTGHAVAVAAAFAVVVAALYGLRAWTSVPAGILLRVAPCLGPAVIVAALSHDPGTQPTHPSAPAERLPPEARPRPVSHPADG